LIVNILRRQNIQNNGLGVIFGVGSSLPLLRRAQGAE
jgi:hypothetical protein